MNDFEHKQHLHKLPLSFKPANFGTVANAAGAPEYGDNLTHKQKFLHT